MKPVKVTQQIFMWAVVRTHGLPFPSAAFIAPELLEDFSVRLRNAVYTEMSL